MSTKIHAAYTLSSARQIPLCWPFLSGPKPPQHERQVCMLRGSRRLVWTLSTASDKPFPKETQTGRFFFHKLVFFPKPEISPNKKKKSKLLKDWVHSCFDFWYIAPLKRDLATSPSDSTQCQGLSLRKTQWKKGLKKKTEHEFITCYEIVSIFNFQFILNFKHWIQCDELFSQRQQKVSNPTFSYFMYSNHLQTS